MLDVTSPLVSGTVLDTNGGPSANALVVLTAPPTPFVLVYPADDTGHFEFPGEPMEAPSVPTVMNVSARNGGRSGRVAGVAMGTQGVVSASSQMGRPKAPSPGSLRRTPSVCR
jgi:hypothetical protein